MTCYKLSTRYFCVESLVEGIFELAIAEVVMRTLKTASLLLIFAAIATHSSQCAFADDLTAEGIKAFRAGDFLRAEQLYRQALPQEDDPQKKAAIFRDLNVLYQAQGKDGSDFVRQADALDPPSKSGLTKADGQSELLINHRDKTNPNASANSNPNPNSNSNFVSQPHQLPSGMVIEPAMSGSRNTLQVDGMSPSNPVMMNGAFGTSSSSSSMFGGAIRGGGSLSGGAFTGGSLNGGSLNGGSFRGGSLGGYRGGSTMGGGFSPNNSSFGSVQNGNNYFEYSANTPIVLPAPNGGAVILNNPGPNIYSTQQAPDGSTTTIMKRTY